MFLTQSCVPLEQRVKLPSTDHHYILERLQVEGMMLEDAENTILELENYYTGLKNGIQSGPSFVVDQAWHTHILNTRMYFDFTQKTFGQYIHHAPQWSGNAETPTLFAYPDLVAIGLKNLNRTIWFSDSIALLTPFDETLASAKLLANCYPTKCNTGCYISR